MPSTTRYRKNWNSRPPHLYVDIWLGARKVPILLVPGKKYPNIDYRIWGAADFCLPPSTRLTGGILVRIAQNGV